MKTAVITLLLGFLVHTGNAQPPKTNKPAQNKPTVSKPKSSSTQADSPKPKPKTTAKKADPGQNKPKTSAAKSASDKPKTAPKKTASNASKQNTVKPGGSNSQHAASLKDKPKPVVKKPNSTAAASTPKQTSKPAAKKPPEQHDAAVSKPRPDSGVKKTSSTQKVSKKTKVEVVEPPPVPDENEEFQKASTVTEPNERIAALGKFVETFPATEKKPQIAELITRARSEMGTARQQAGDMDGAIAYFMQAAMEAPKPIPDQLYTDVFAKLPSTLFFGNQRQKGLDLAKVLEERSEMSAGQLLNLAAFYLSIEDGTDALRVAEKAVQIEPTSSPGYQTLGLANRMDFRLDESATAFAKALELDPTSMSARRGLAEMKRALGKADDALSLYREILAKDAESVNARNGLILSLFEANKRSEAESEMAASLSANPNNVVLLAGAAYWYAAHNEGDKAIEYGNKAIAVEPRYIWSHVALARGQMLQKKPLDAERTLLAARRYGNFPTLEYEIASARLMAGFYRDAAEELNKNFSAEAGVVHVNLGLRISKESKYLTELIGFERRASIFAPTAADNPALAAQLASLLEITEEVEEKTPNIAALNAAVDTFVKGDDNMKVHRQIYAAALLLEKKVSLPKVVELTKAASGNADAALDAPSAASAVMASELYESRTIANARGEFVKIPEVPKPTLSAIIRGRIEEINGWGHYEMDNPNEAVLHLRRAVSVMPGDSAWWRSSVWRLGSALVKSGKDAEGLDEYIRCYRSSSPDIWRYELIENLYKKVKGNSDGLEAKIGPKPAPPLVADSVAQNTESVPPPPLKIEPTPTPTPVKPEKSAPVAETIPLTVPVKEVVKPAATPTPEPKVDPAPEPASTPELKTDPTPTPEPKAEPAVKPTPISARDTVIESGVQEKSKPALEQPTPTPEPKKIETPTPEPSPAATPPAEAVAKVIPGSETRLNEAQSSKVDDKKPDSGAEQKRMVVTEKDPFPKPAATPFQDEINPMAGGPVKPTPQPTPQKNSSSSTALKDLFPPVVISLPDSKAAKSDTSTTEQAKKEGETAKKSDGEKSADEGGRPEAPRARVVDKPAAPVITPCTITATDDNLTLQNSGGNVAILVGIQGASDISSVTSRTNSPADLEVKPGPEIAGIKDRALFVIRSLSAKLGIFQVMFELPCGKKEVLVKVK